MSRNSTRTVCETIFLYTQDGRIRRGTYRTQRFTGYHERLRSRYACKTCYYEIDPTLPTPFGPYTEIVRTDTTQDWKETLEAFKAQGAALDAKRDRS